MHYVSHYATRQHLCAELLLLVQAPHGCQKDGNIIDSLRDQFTHGVLPMADYNAGDHNYRRICSLYEFWCHVLGTCRPLLLHGNIIQEPPYFFPARHPGFLRHLSVPPFQLKLSLPSSFLEDLRHAATLVSVHADTIDAISNLAVTTSSNSGTSTSLTSIVHLLQCNLRAQDKAIAKLWHNLR